MNNKTTEAEKFAKAMAALDTMATVWAASFDIRQGVLTMKSLPDGTDRLIAFIKHSYAEGLYAGRTSLRVAQPVQPTPDADFKESVALMLAAVGYTETYARQWPNEKVSVTFKRWFDEQIENAKTAQPEQPSKGLFIDMIAAHGTEFAAEIATSTAQPVQPANLSDELIQLGLQELYAFQEATGCDKAEQFIVQPVKGGSS